MAHQDRIPATIITGFLGAGKSTLVQSIIRQAGGRRIALIVNEFGDMGFDGDLVSDCGDPTCQADEIIELTNGCICCTVADDFLPTMEQLLARDPKPDHIVIETSGLALPQPLVRAFNWPSIKPHVTVDGVVTVVDGLAVAGGHVAVDEDAVARQRAADEALDHESPIEDLFEDQLRCADLVVISKSDLLDTRARDRVVARIGGDLRSGVHHVTSDTSGVPIAVLLGRDAGAEDDMAVRTAHHEHSHDDDAEPHAHDHDDFESFILVPRSFASVDEARAAIVDAMAVDGVLRIKGRVTIDGKALPARIQAVGPRVEAWHAPRDEAATGLVVIGLHDDLDRAGVEALLSAPAVMAAE
ncbi:MAG: cobalamin biosynthesis protein CobW [Pseudomonadota bacterium]